MAFADGREFACDNGLRWSFEIETNGISPNRE